MHAVGLDTAKRLATAVKVQPCAKWYNQIANCLQAL